MHKSQSSIVSKETSSHFVWGEICYGWWLKKEGIFTVIEEIMPPGASEKRHKHNITEQFFYVLDGTLSITLNECDTYQLQKNQGLAIPPKVIHRAFNDSNSDLRFLVISSPNSHDDRIDLKEEHNG